MPTGGSVLVAALRALDVEVAFGLPGVHNLAAWEAFPGSGVRLVGVRHEQTAGYAADGYARATGRLGVALTTTGPGAANVVAATGEAWSCHSPVLVIATDIPTTQRLPGVYRGVLHETTDQAAFFGPVTKAVVRVSRAEDLYGAVVRAGRTALAAPCRPVYLEVPTDLLSADVPAPEEIAPEPAAAAPVHSDAVAAALVSAGRPLIWAGGGAIAAGAGELVGQLARRLGAPVLTSYGGRGLLPPEAPELVPLPPHAPEAGALWDDADVVLVVGSDLDGMNTQGFRQPRPPRLLTIDLAEPVTYPPDEWVAADVALALGEVLAQLPAGSRAPWWTRPAGRASYAGPETKFLDAFEAALPPEVVVVADMCIPGYWYGAFGRVGSARGLAYPVGWGTLGFGFPAALGAALSGRPTIALVGDGGFLYACGDLATAVQEQLPVTIVLVDDGGYGMLRYDFTRRGDEPVGCDLVRPDFVALAHSFGVPARKVEEAGLSAAISEGLGSGGPSMVVLEVAFSPPLTTSPRWYRAGDRGGQAESSCGSRAPGPGCHPGNRTAAGIACGGPEERGRSMDDGLLVEVRDRVGYVTIDRPERRNALSDATFTGLVEIFTRFDADDDVWIAVITGAGDQAFSAGRDLKELAGRDPGEPPPNPMRQPMRNPFEAVYECRKPTVAALNGVALGGGLELAMACDVRIAADHARLALPEVLRGMGATFGASVLPRLVPLGVAYDMLYTGRTLTAAEAERWGLVNRVVPGPELASAADEYARSLLQNAPLTMRRYKALIQSGLHQSVPAALRLDVRPDPYSSEDRVEGVRAFAEKRAPRWQAR